MLANYSCDKTKEKDVRPSAYISPVIPIGLANIIIVFLLPYGINSLQLVEKVYGNSQYSKARQHAYIAED